MAPAILETALGEHLCNAYVDGKFPLFVIGSGISHERVPFLKDMVDWLQLELKRLKDQKDSPLKKEPEELGLEIDPALMEVLLKQAASLTTGRASRFDAAGFFSAFQFAGTEKGLNQIWERFTKGLVAEGLTFPSKKKSVGLIQLKYDHCSTAHKILARVLTRGLCHLVNLNYDPLLQLAVTHAPPTAVLDRFISLYTPDDISRYYSAPLHIVDGHFDEEFAHQAAAVHVRGDIFFATCGNKQCPQHGKSRTIDTARYHDADDIFICPSCHQNSSKLQLSFPGYETKEKLIGKIFATLIKFIGFQLSSIICVGVSGQWDQYLLDEVFSRAVEFQIPIVDVRPTRKSEANYFDLFRLRFYPSVPVQYEKQEPTYLRWNGTADTFMQWFDTATEPILSPTTELEREDIFALKP